MNRAWESLPLAVRLARVSTAQMLLDAYPPVVTLDMGHVTTHMLECYLSSGQLIWLRRAQKLLARLYGVRCGAHHV